MFSRGPSSYSPFLVKWGTPVEKVAEFRDTHRAVAVPSLDEGPAVLVKDVTAARAAVGLAAAAASAGEVEFKASEEAAPLAGRRGGGGRAGSARARSSPARSGSQSVAVSAAFLSTLRTWLDDAVAEGGRARSSSMDSVGSGGSARSSRSSMSMRSLTEADEQLLKPSVDTLGGWLIPRGMEALTVQLQATVRRRTLGEGDEKAAAEAADRVMATGGMLDTYVRAGQAEDEGESMTGWITVKRRRRWAVLRKRHLLLFKRQTDKVPKKEYDVKGCVARYLKAPCDFELRRSNGKKYKVEAETPEERDKWVTSLQSVSVLLHEADDVAAAIAEVTGVGLEDDGSYDDDDDDDDDDYDDDDDDYDEDDDDDDNDASSSKSGFSLFSRFRKSKKSKKSKAPTTPKKKKKKKKRKKKIISSPSHRFNREATSKALAIATRRSEESKEDLPASGGGDDDPRALSSSVEMPDLRMAAAVSEGTADMSIDDSRSLAHKLQLYAQRLRHRDVLRSRRAWDAAIRLAKSLSESDELLGCILANHGVSLLSDGHADEAAGLFASALRPLRVAGLLLCGRVEANLVAALASALRETEADAIVLRYITSAEGRGEDCEELRERWATVRELHAEIRRREEAATADSSISKLVL